MAAMDASASKAAAEELKAEGNAAFAAKKLDEALTAYGKGR